MNNFRKIIASKITAKENGVICNKEANFKKCRINSERKLSFIEHI